MAMQKGGCNAKPLQVSERAEQGQDWIPGLEDSAGLPRDLRWQAGSITGEGEVT